MRAKVPNRYVKLLKFETFYCQAKKPVTTAVLSTQALITDKLLLASVLLDKKQYKDISAFKDSKNWTLAFTKPHALWSLYIYGEAGSVDAAVVAGLTAQICKRLTEYTPECIYNINNTGLFYKLMLWRTYVLSTKNHRYCRRAKNLGLKDRIAPYVCTNADGSENWEWQ